MLLLEKLITFLIFVHSSKTTYSKKQREYFHFTIMQRKTLYGAKAEKCKVGYEKNMRDYNRLSGKTSVNRVSVYRLVII